MKDKNEALENETSIVKWYIAVLEEGHDTREVIGLYEKLKKEHVKLQEETDTELEKLTSHLKKSEAENRRLLKKLESQQEKVVKPLIQECASREKKLNDYRN